MPLPVGLQHPHLLPAKSSLSAKLKAIIPATEERNDALTLDAEAGIARMIAPRSETFLAGLCPGPGP